MPVRAVIIRPDSVDPTEIELTEDPGSTTHRGSLREALGARMVDLIRLERGQADAFVDDEYLYAQTEPNVIATRVLLAYGVDFGGRHVLGPVIFTAHDGHGGTVSLDDEQLRVLHDAARQASYM